MAREGNKSSLSVGVLARRFFRLGTKLARDCGTWSSNRKFGDRARLAEETIQWLEANQRERMDACVDLFDENRRQFHLDRYCFATRWVRGMRVIDCASGTGYGARVLREAGNAKEVVGVEIDKAAVEYASKKHGIEGTRFICASGDCIPISDGFTDVITSFETIEHVEEDVALLAEFHRVLRTGGVLIISTPNQWPVAVSPFHLREYNRQSFLKALERWFECIEMYNQNSGTGSPYNHGQPAGIVQTTPENEALAECYIAVCRRKS